MYFVRLSVSLLVLSAFSGLSMASSIVEDKDLPFSEGTSRDGFNLFININELGHLWVRGEPRDVSSSVGRSPLRKPRRAVVIYQLEPRTYLATGVGESYAGKLAYLTTERLMAIKDLNVDYIWLTGVLEHTTPNILDPDVVKGNAGSYYAIYDNWDISRQVGNLQYFAGLVDRAHSVGLRILIDLIPNHTARIHKTDIPGKASFDFGLSDQKDKSFSLENNYYYLGNNSTFVPPRTNQPGTDGIFDTDLYQEGYQTESPAKVTGNNVLSAQPNMNDWYETIRLNYGYNVFDHNMYAQTPNRTWLQMVNIASYWLAMGVDGFRVDFAHGVPLQFWRYFAEKVRQQNPDAFLLAEAFEGDSLGLPGFSFDSMFWAGFDSVYNPKMYWNLRRQAEESSDMQGATYSTTAGMRDYMLQHQLLMTHYLGNHDEVRLAARHFAPSLAHRGERADLGFALSAYAALLPGHFLHHGGDELQEDAEVYGPFAGDNGRTSIFDFVYQPFTKTWLEGRGPLWMNEFRAKYKRLMQFKKSIPFGLTHSYVQPTFVELVNANSTKAEARWVSAYLRFFQSERYVVVLNADPVNSHRTTIHFTPRDNQDPLGALSAMGISNDGKRFTFTEVLTTRGWVPKDPALSGCGIPGWALHRAGNVPSGLHLGDIPPRTVYVFQVARCE